VQPSPPAQRTYRHFDTIFALFVAVLVISNVLAGAKQFAIGPFVFPGALVIFPISYIFGDVLTEVYGYARARRVIWTGFACNGLLAAAVVVVGLLPDARGPEHQAAYGTILGLTPFVVLGSLVGYFVGEFANSYTLAKMKILTSGRYLWTRTIGSTIVGETIDTTLFVHIAFTLPVALGTPGPPWSVIATMWYAHALAKILYEVAATPITYALVFYLKRAENEDYFDRTTDFNPFRVSSAP
jgi:uncharacterized integral membrane protein (TIGR00697 family)